MSAVCPVNEMDVVAAFGDALRDAGCRLDVPPIMDGQRRRVRVEGDKRHRKSGSYVGHFDGGWPAGHIRNFRDESRSGNWKYGGDGPRLTPEERSALSRKRALAEQARARKRAARLERIAQKSVERWEAAPSAPKDHPYLVRKGIGPEGLRIDGDLLLVPMRDAEGRLRCLQTIEPDGTKLFPSGSQVHGLHLLLGEVHPDGVLLIEEGFATAVKVYDAKVSGAAVACAFSNTNFVVVARTYQERVPGLRIAFGGDNDHHHPRRDKPLPNVGKDAAEAAAREVAGSVAILPHFEPHEDGTDWDDFGLTHGLDAVRAAIEAKLPPPPLPLKPHYPAPRLTRDEAMNLLDATFRIVLQEAADRHAVHTAWTAEQKAIDGKAPVGSPERRKLLKEARARMAVAHDADWKRCEERGRRVLLLGSAGTGKSTRFARELSLFHELGRDVGRVSYLSNLRGNCVALAEKTKGGVAVHGRLAPDPKAQDGALMCLRPQAAEAVVRAGLPVGETLCAKDGVVCPLFERCGYRRHQREIESGDYPYRFGAHEHLTKPARVMRDPALVVLDESVTEKLAGHI